MFSEQKTLREHQPIHLHVTMDDAQQAYVQRSQEAIRPALYGYSGMFHSGKSKGLLSGNVQKPLDGLSLRNLK